MSIRMTVPLLHLKTAICEPLVLATSTTAPISVPLATTCALEFTSKSFNLVSLPIWTTVLDWISTPKLSLAASLMTVPFALVFQLWKRGPLELFSSLPPPPQAASAANDIKALKRVGIYIYRSS